MIWLLIIGTFVAIFITVYVVGERIRNGWDRVDSE